MKINETLKKFGYPDTLIIEYEHWCILLRYEQVTLGSLMLVCKDDVTKFSDISNGSFIEYGNVIHNIEKKLQERFQYDKINYLMLMMVDPNVHFHVIPRYFGSKEFKNIVFNDPGWPGIPEISKYNKISSELFFDLKEELKKIFD